MTSKNDGGPAFPTHLEWAEEGMSLRDCFAAKAMAAMLGGPFCADTLGIERSIAKAGVSDLQQLIARNAYDIADTMLRERDK